MPLCLQVKAALSEKSKSLGPPTSCDVLFYYAELKMATGRHRDAFEAWELNEYHKKSRTAGANPKSLKFRDVHLAWIALGLSPDKLLVTSRGNASPPTHNAQPA